MTPRRFTPEDDAAPLIALIARAFAGMEGRIDPPSSMHRLTPESVAAQARDGEIWMVGDPPVACVFLTPEAGSLYVHKLAVDPPSKRRGLGRALVTLAARRAGAMGLPALTLSTRIELTENHATFRAMGFVETGRSAHPGFDRPTTLHFTLEVPP